MPSDFKIKKVFLRLFDRLLDLIKTIFKTAAVMIFVCSFIARLATVSGSSMEPALFQGDILLILSLGYKPKQGDIVACYCEGLKKVIVKRIIAVGGQLVDIDFNSGKVFANGAEFFVPGIENKTLDQKSWLSYPVKVPEGKYFVMGDNRRHSTDSRNSAVGFVDRSDILGRAAIRLFPFKKAGML